MLPRLRVVAPAAVSLVVMSGLTAAQGSASRAVAPADLDTPLLQVHTSGNNRLPDGPYRLVGTGYASQFGVTADGTVVSAVDDYFGRPAPSSLVGSDLVQIDAGYRHGLALDRDGEVHTWGVLGDDPDSVPASVPQDIASTDLVQVAAGGDHDLGLTTDGTVVAWGSAGSSGAAVVPAGLDGVAEVEAGFYSSAALLDNGRVRSWGFPGPTPAQYADRTFTDVAASTLGVLALTADGDVVGWGNDGVGQVPAEVSAGTAIAIAAGDRAAAVLSDGTLVQWGGSGREIDSPSVPAGSATVELQWGRYSAALLSEPNAPTEAPSIREARPPHAGLAVLTANPGRWDDLTEPEFSYSWLLNGQKTGTDSPRLTVPWSRLGATVRLVVTASDGSQFGRATSDPLQLRVPRARFTPQTRASVRRSEALPVRASGLAPNEPFSVVLGGEPIATGTASRRGRVDVRGLVTRRIGLGRQRLVLVGATEQRFGSVAIVVRRGAS